MGPGAGALINAFTPNPTSTGPQMPNTGAIRLANAPQPGGVLGAETVAAPSPTATGNAATGAPANTNPNFGAQMSSIRGMIGQLNGLYNTLFSNFNQGVAGQRQSIDQNYADQAAQLNQQYQNTVPWLQFAENARGAGDSSDAYMQQQQAVNTLNTQGQQINDARVSAEDDLARQAAGQLGQYQGQLQGINNQAAQLGQIQNDAASNYRLSDIQGQLNQDFAPLQGAIGSAQNSQQLANQLNVQAPSQQFNPQQLQTQLQALSKSSVPQFAQNQLASGFISSNAPTNSNYWLNYWKNLSTPAAT